MIVNGTPVFQQVLSSNDFKGPAQTTFNSLQSQGSSFAMLSVPPAQNVKNPAKADPKKLAMYQPSSNNLASLEKTLTADTGNWTCLGACFAAGTLMLTKRGWLRVEDVIPGDWVLSRDESDATGVGEWKQVEARFERTGRVLHLHLAGGELIRTTPEHPFWVAEKGWTPAGDLHAGDRLGTLEGDWVTIGELYDTGEYEKVYNLRVADWHTYFVGGEGCAVWAHNAACDPPEASMIGLLPGQWKDVSLEATVPVYYPVGYNPTSVADPYDFKAVKELVARLAVSSGTGSNNQARRLIKDGTLSNPSPPNPTPIQTLGKKSDDVGHIIGNQFGGPGGLPDANGNIFPQAYPENRGPYSSFETNTVKPAVKAGKVVYVDITFTYPPSNATSPYRPTGFTYDWWINGTKQASRSFDNP